MNAIADVVVYTSALMRLIAADKRFMVHINCLLIHCFSSLLLGKTAQSISLNYIPNDKCLLITDEMTQMK